MKWIKKGLIWGPDGTLPWAKHSALTPTPIVLRENEIRIYAGFRDDRGVSRIGYVDVEARNPSQVIRVSQKPVLNTGKPGAFDDNGMILGDIVRRENKLYMYYVGFQLADQVKFLAFTGLAISHDNGETFERYSQAPILDRDDHGLFIMAIHSVLFQDSKWKVWYSAGNGWEIINDIPYPQYHIWYTESTDGIHFPDRGNLCIDVEGNEYRIGRPRVYRVRDKYIMYYTKGTIDGDYLAGYAESIDGVNWLRIDAESGIVLSESGWDSEALSYPALVWADNDVYMFYNGNQMGKEGFGFSSLQAW